MIELAQTPNVAPPMRDQPGEEVIADFLDCVRKTDCFDPGEVEWIESILTREDTVDGYMQLTSPFAFSRADQAENLYAVCKEYNKTVDKLSPVERHDARMVLRRLLWAKRISCYKPQKVIVASPQRKQHIKYPVPNLERWEGPGQHATAHLIAVYGYDYCEARTQCVKQALADADATHIFFVDDDVLIPKDALQRLLGYGLKSVSGLYLKKSPGLMSTITTSDDHPELIYSQQTISPAIGDYAPHKASCVGGGMWLLSLDVFRKIPEPWFQMILGPDRKVVVGEDSAWVRKMAGHGVETYVVPGIIGLHVDFETGDQYAPVEIVDPLKRRVREEYRASYQAWPDDLDLKELMAPDKIDYFGKNTRGK